ncbi:MAG: glycoside hydrolase family 25 protein [Lachnospiraceae bacterium]|nr:glycoside hydrolase family 25 protein [Lachnospiraceae bacterium]
MKLDDDFDENSGGLPIIYMALGVSFFIFLILCVVISLNKDKNSSKDKITFAQSAELTAAANEAEPVPTPESVSKRVASDLDIWDLYPERDDEEDEMSVTLPVTPKITPTPTVTATPTAKPDYDDGKHVKITYKDGSEEWITINDKIEKNNYDFTNLVESGGKYRYMSDGKNISFIGIDVSRYQKDIDFKRVKEQGIDFVMIRVGARGYKNGTLTMDEYFENNLNSALEAGLDVGVYFFSQAINAQEAEEEANIVLAAIAEKKITYPIAFDMEYIENDTSRIDTLTKEEKTLVTAAFVNKIKEAGYRPMIYGNKEWLLKRIDISQFTTSSFWLSQDDEYPDYPYKYDIWQYTTEGELYGIDGAVDMDICFVDYAAQ